MSSDTTCTTNGDDVQATTTSLGEGLNGGEGHQTRLTAPLVRIEKLKDQLTVSTPPGSSTGSSLYGTDDEGRSGETSDADGGGGGTEPGGAAGEDTKRTGDFEIPSDEVKQRIIDQVEYYFSDANILSDTFMLKHVRRNKLGYVSLKLITSFRKVKQLAKEYQTVAYCLRDSTKLQVNEDGTKVCRIDPIPSQDETCPSRTIVAVNLNLGPTPTVEAAAELFSRYGEIVLLRIIRPDRPIPADIKRYVTKHREIGHTTCAVVEYAKVEGARCACEEMTDKDNWRSGGIRVMPLQPMKPLNPKDAKIAARESEVNSGGGKKENETKNKNKNKKKKEVNGATVTVDRTDEDLREVKIEELSLDGEVKNVSGDEGGWKRKCGNQGMDDVGNKGGLEGAGSSGVNKDLSKSVIRSSLCPQQDTSRLSPGTSPRGSPRSSPKSSPRGSPNPRRRSVHGQSPLTVENNGGMGASPLGGSSPSQSPWVQRRLKAQLEDSPLSANNSPGASPRLGRKEGTGAGFDTTLGAGSRNVIRQPRGPDGTNGFHDLNGTDKLLARATPEV